jgi:hypothetical protein
VYPKVSGLAAWSESCKWYSSLPLGVQLYRYFMSQSSEFCRYDPLWCFSTSNTKGERIFSYRLSPETFGYTLVQYNYYQSTLLGTILSHFHPPTTLTTYLSNIRLNVIFPTPNLFSNWTFSLPKLRTQSLFSELATCQTHLSVLNFTTLTILRKPHKSQSSSLL